MEEMIYARWEPAGCRLPASGKSAGNWHGHGLCGITHRSNGATAVAATAGYVRSGGCGTCVRTSSHMYNLSHHVYVAHARTPPAHPHTHTAAYVCYKLPCKYAINYLPHTSPPTHTHTPHPTKVRKGAGAAPDVGKAATRKMAACPVLLPQPASVCKSRMYRM